LQSNPGRTGKNEQWRASGGDQQWHRPCLRWCSTGAHQRHATGHSEARITMGFWPMAPQWWVTVAAGNREAVQPRLDNGEGDLQCLLNDLDSSYVGRGPP
jgi:hypothetical protein